jgi:phosphatidylglycerol---prolipoprotein diacylglyceryl transferase
LHPFLAYIGSFPIRSYSLLFISAYLLGLGITVTLAKLKGRNELVVHILDLSIPMFLGAIVGSRFWQVFLFDWGYYSKHPSEIVAIWHGGLSIQGGIVGALIVGIWYIKKHNLSFWEMADLFAPGLVLGQSIGRDANLMNGDAFGDPTGSNFGMLYPVGSNARDTFGDQPLWPAEVWEGQMDVILFAILFILLQRKLKRGYLFVIYNILYSIGRFLLELLRGDTPRYWGLTTAQWTAIGMILLSIGAWIYLSLNSRNSQEGTVGGAGGGF